MCPHMQRILETSRSHRQPGGGFDYGWTLHHVKVETNTHTHTQTALARRERPVTVTSLSTHTQRVTTRMHTDSAPRRTRTPQRYGARFDNRQVDLAWVGRA